MKNPLTLLAQLLTTIAKLLWPGGVRAVVADRRLTKQQLIVIERSRRRVPDLSALDRIQLSFRSLFQIPHRLPWTAMIIRPSTLLKFRTRSTGERIDCCSRLALKKN